VSSCVLMEEHTCSKPRNLMMLRVTDGWKRSPPAGRRVVSSNLCRAQTIVSVVRLHQSEPMRVSQGGYGMHAACGMRLQCAAEPGAAPLYGPMALENCTRKPRLTCWWPLSSVQHTRNCSTRSGSTIRSCARQMCQTADPFAVTQTCCDADLALLDMQVVYESNSYARAVTGVTGGL